MEPERSKTRSLMIGAIAMALVVVIYLLFIETPSDQASEFLGNRDTIHDSGSVAAEETVSEPTADTGGESVSDASNDDEMRRAITREIIISKLQEMYGGNIRHPRIQLQAIQKLISYLKQLYPQNWRDHVSDFLSAAFPDEAEAMYDRYLSLQEYTQWLQDDYRTILSMSASERSDYLWARRKLFFGEDASDIWADELADLQVADALEEINQLEQVPFEEKVHYFNARLEEIYADEAEAYKRKQSQKVMDLFLSTESVQEDLQKMTVAQRQKNLDEFRRSIGLDEPAIKRWSDLDAARDQRWAAGARYMQVRGQIINEYSGIQQSQKLDDLRNELFGPEAEMIKDEEQSGFHRFNRRRVYGKN